MPARRHRQGQAAVARHRGEFGLHAVEQFVEREIDRIGDDRAGIEPRNLEQRLEQVLHQIERRPRLSHQRARRRRETTVAERGDESRAALSGWSRSWLAAARKRVLEMLACSAAVFAARIASSADSRSLTSSCNRAVRSSTRRSSVSLVSCSASAAASRPVMSSKLITIPPSAIDERRTSTVRPLAWRRCATTSGDPGAASRAAGSRHRAVEPDARRDQIGVRHDQRQAIGGQADRRQERPVPRGQPAVGVVHAHAQPDRVERRLQDRGLLRHLARPLARVVGLDLGDVGIDADDAAFAGAQLVDLDPAPVGQRVDVPALEPLGGADARRVRIPAIRARRARERRVVVADRAGELVEGDARNDAVGDVRPQP